MKTRLFPFLAGVFAVLLALEIAFQILPVATATRSGYYQHPLILSYPAGHCFISSTGWDLKNAQRNCANNIGFLAGRDFLPDRNAIGLIGDSYVEASMLPVGQRLAAMLENKLSGRPVYAFGGPGSNLLDYAERAKFAAEKFGIRTFVFILERGDIKQAQCGSGHIHGVCVDGATGQVRSETQPQPGALKRILRHSALAQYLVSQLKIDVSKLKPSAWTTPAVANASPKAEIPDERQNATVAAFFSQISKIQDGRFLFVVDPDRGHLLEAGAGERNEVAARIRYAGDGRTTVIDPGEAFKDHLVRTGRLLDVGPYDRHWNAEAIDIVTELVRRALIEPAHK
ncbi:MAG: hypothetical protein CVU33_10555 [Betaproteobacteria bacterium HGW-Betaproteobacteria-6]|jgi:hypothetical protein|uniref:Uncharacterized protein n=1 Tax=Candidatus Anoxymicrobium japonicum TaxID=2013648 RepID=A0A2N3G5S3_9ACTN|nr:MAG: hypothetical protein CVU33_10555 [Betaproteobacteria bacterium HGW-Betaproteobacteria-6]PKQ28053.1 MAG: hypothetical protein CVT63_04805 [Candidatus Anoxymicrobium japonicum]